MKYKLITFFLIALCATACVRAPETIKDVSDLRQNHLAYLPPQTPSQDLITAENQALLDEDYNIIYFSVWHQHEPFYATPENVAADSKRFSNNLGFGENKRRHTKEWYISLLKNAALDNYPNNRYPAITIRNTSLRSLPTAGPHFASAEGDSDSWPFDNLQRSAVAVNAPLFVCHVSTDKAWALVETCFTFGWMPVSDFAPVDSNFIRKWESGRFAVVTRDQTTVFNRNGRFLFKASLGYVFPLVRETPGKMEILTAASGKDADSAIIRKSYLPAETAVVKPLRLNSLNAVKIANELIGEPYGWGGLYGNRDCSSMTRDFFAVFGMWLPRHSEDQVKEAGRYIDLNGMSAAQKEKMIMDKGKPYLTLLWRKGHVMLYIGAQNGQALIFHNIWGIRTKDLRGREGRKIIGQAVITTLRPGRELRNFDAGSGDLLTNITGMSILGEQQKPAGRQMK